MNTAQRVLRSRPVLLATVSAGGIASYYLYREYQDLKQLQQLLLDQQGGSQAAAAKLAATTLAGGRKKQVLTIPFDQLKLTQQPADSSAEWVRKLRKLIPVVLGQADPDSLNDGPIVMPVSELVALLHTAAADPNICALAGRFSGGGGGAGIAGLTNQGYAWADAEDIRGALVAFSQSHRRHSAPNLQHEAVVLVPRVEPKPMYCYANTFLDYNSGSGLMASGNVNYYLASAFTHVHLQQRGELGLLGVAAQNFFVRGLLEQYGVQMHVFKHGAYKTAPNLFTQSSLTREHRESVENMVHELDSDLSLEMTASRSKALLRAWLTAEEQQQAATAGVASSTSMTALLGGNFDDWVNKVMNIWGQVHEAGAYPAASAWSAGLVDYLPRRDPLPALLAYNQASTHQERAQIQREWTVNETDFASFPANEAISLKQYARQQKKLKQLRDKQKSWQGFWKKYGLGQMPSLLKKLGSDDNAKDSDAPPTTEPSTQKPKKEKVLLMNVSGAIDGTMARKLVKNLRQAMAKNTDDESDNDSQNIKCVVLRITSPGGDAIASETISQELQALKVPVVVSMGNVAASGGYYIAAHADRIFASNKTLTGSIGVFAVRADLTGLAHKYGVTTEPVAAGTLASTFDSFTPMSRSMQDGVSDAIDRCYDNFKTIVAEGRRLDKNTVEALAQGKIWTGRQAKEIGLVDEIGGLDRALIYAKRTYCTESAEKNEDGTHKLEHIEVVNMQNKNKMSLSKLMQKLGDTDDKDNKTGDPYSVSAFDPSQSFWQNVAQQWLSGFEEDDDDCGMHLFPTTQNGLQSTQGFCQWLLQQNKANLPGTFSSGILMTANENTAIQLLMKDAYKKQQ